MGAPSSVIPGERANVPLDGAIEEMLYPVSGRPVPEMEGFLTSGARHLLTRHRENEGGGVDRFCFAMRFPLFLLPCILSSR